MSWKNFPWQYNRYNISVWPRYLMITVLQLWKLFSDSAWDSHIFTFDFIISCSRTASLSNISWNVLKVLVALFPLPTEPDIVQQNSEERLYTRQEFHYLNVIRVGATMATDESDCCFQCLRNPLWFSVNVAASQTVRKRLWCELLPFDKYNSAEKYQPNKSSHHISIMVRLIFE